MHFQYIPPAAVSLLPSFPLGGKGGVQSCSLLVTLCLLVVGYTLLLEPSSMFLPFSETLLGHREFLGLGPKS